MDPDYYNVITQPSTAEFRERGSKFIGYAFPVENVAEAKSQLATVKAEHPKATHHCYAYRIGTTGNIFRVSDDGEPSGSAGRPILGQIDSKQVTNTLIIVVRYFGGTLLGIPGLIHSYKTTAALALQVTPVVSRPVLVIYNVQFDYTQMNEIMRIVKQFGCIINHQETQLFCSMDICIPVKLKDEVLYKFGELQGIEIKEVKVLN